MATRKEKTTKSRTAIRPGTYEAIVTACGYDDSYAGDGAFSVTYELTSGNGKKIKHSEVFFDNDYNDRTWAFKEHLYNLGITVENLDDFVGCKERIIVKKIVRNNRALPGIVEREFISFPEGDTDGLAAE